MNAIGLDVTAHSTIEPALIAPAELTFEFFKRLKHVRLNAPADFESIVSKISSENIDDLLSDVKLFKEYFSVYPNEILALLRLKNQYTWTAVYRIINTNESNAFAIFETIANYRQTAFFKLMNEPHESFKSPFHFAVELDRRTIIDLIAKFRLDDWIIEEFGLKSQLNEAMEVMDTLSEVFEHLMKNHLDQIVLFFKKRDSSGVTSLEKQLTARAFLLIEAMAKSHPTLCAALMRECGLIDIKYIDLIVENHTVFHCLLTQFPDHFWPLLNKTNEDGTTVFHRMMVLYSPSYFESLAKIHVDFASQLKRTSSSGYSPLDIALGRRQAGILRYLPGETLEKWFFSQHHLVRKLLKIMSQYKDPKTLAASDLTEDQLRKRVISVVTRSDQLKPYLDQLMHDHELDPRQVKMYVLSTKNVTFLGNGAFGDVLRVFNISTGNFVALKKPRHRNGVNDLIKECRILTHVHSKGPVENIVEAPDLCYPMTKSGKVGLVQSVYPLYRLGSLEAAVRRDSRILAELTFREKVMLCKQLLLGIKALKELGVQNCDIKLANCLLDRRSDGSIKLVIADFGQAKYIGSTDVGSLDFMGVVCMFKDIMAAGKAEDRDKTGPFLKTLTDCADVEQALKTIETFL